MSRERANRCLGAIVGCLFVLAVQAIGAQRDADRDRDDTCWRLYGKQYDAQHRACVRPQR